MNLRKGNVSIWAITIALITMVISLCVPHHHHEEAVCIGNYDCKGEPKHSHHDDCEGEDSKTACWQSFAYVDSRSVDDDFVPPVLGYDGLAGLVYQLIVCGAEHVERCDMPYWQAPYVAPQLSFKSLRSPPVC